MKIRKKGLYYIRIPINMENQFYQINILQLLIKWKLHLLLILIVATILSTIFSGPSFITPKYKSYAIIYPSNLAPYSDESETEQMLQIIQSKDIKDSIIEKFNLCEHYKINRDNKYSNTTMMNEYSQNVKIKRTQYDGVNIIVTDTDPQLACDLVNGIIKFFNLKVQKLHREKYQEVADIYKEMMELKLEEIDTVKNILTELQIESNILDFATQTKEVVKGYLGTIDGDNAKYIDDKKVASLKEKLEKKGRQFIIYDQNLNYLLSSYNSYKNEYDEAIREINKNYTYSNVITNPFPADKKSHPIRWFIVVVSALASFFISFILILVFENYNIMTNKGSINQTTCS